MRKLKDTGLSGANRDDRRRGAAYPPLDDDGLHDDSSLMIPPPGFKFIPRFETVCGKPGCFECFDIYCERCESKDRRIVELEMRNNDLVKYITQLQGRVFGREPASAPAFPSGAATLPRTSGHATASPVFGGPPNVPGTPVGRPGAFGQPGGGTSAAPGTSEPFAYIQSPVLYDPNMNVSYVATTTFAPAPHEQQPGPSSSTAPKP